MHIHLRVRAAQTRPDPVNKGQTIVELEVESRELTHTEQQTLNSLFPNTYLTIERALATEALIESQVKD